MRWRSTLLFWASTSILVNRKQLGHHRVGRSRFKVCQSCVLWLELYWPSSSNLPSGWSVARGGNPNYCTHAQLTQRELDTTLACLMIGRGNIEVCVGAHERAERVSNSVQLIKSNGLPASSIFYVAVCCLPSGWATASPRETKWR